MSLEDSPAGLASLIAMREILQLLSAKGVLTPGEICASLDAIWPDRTPPQAEAPFDHALYNAMLWLKGPHLAAAVMEYSARIQVAEATKAADAEPES